MAGGVPALHPERKGTLNWSPKANAVEKRGGLPAYVVSVATALMRGGMTRERAIASARSGLKKTCATGHWFGRPKIPVSGAIRAAACGAVASLAARNLSHEQQVEALELAQRERGLLEFSAPRLLLELARDAHMCVAPLLEMAEKKIPAKARERAAAKNQTAYGTSFPIRNRDELRRAISAYGRAPADKRALLRRFIIRRAKALGAASMIPDSWKADGSLASA